MSPLSTSPFPPVRSPIALFLPDVDKGRRPKLHAFLALVGKIHTTVNQNLNWPRFWGFIPLPIWLRHSDRFKSILNQSPSDVLSQLGNNVAGAKFLNFAALWRRVHFCFIVADRESKQHRGVFVFDILTLPARHAYHHHIRVRSDAGDLCAQFMRNVIDLYTACEITQIKLVAGYTAGGAVWPKYGFKVDPLSDDLGDLVNIVKTRVETAPPVILDRYKAHTGRCLREDVESLAREPDSSFPLDIVDIDERDKIKHQDHPYGIGGWLLQNTRWSAILDLADPTSRGRLETYLDAKLLS